MFVFVGECLCLWVNVSVCGGMFVFVGECLCLWVNVSVCG